MIGQMQYGAVALLFGLVQGADKMEPNTFVDPQGERVKCFNEEKCMEGQYFNALACKCFYAAQCMMICPEKGQALSPASMCECVDQEEIKGMFPEWAEFEDVQRSMVEGVMDNQRWSDKDDHDDDDDNTEKVERVIDAVEELQHAAEELFGMDGAIALSGLGAIAATVTMLGF